MMDFFLFNATIWLGGIVILCIISAVVSNPIPAICGGIFAIAMFVSVIKLYGKGIEVTTKLDDVSQDKDGNFILKGNGHAVCLMEYYEGFWWTYDLVDKKYIKPTTCKEARLDIHGLNSCNIRDFKHMLSINGYTKQAWSEYLEHKKFYDEQHYRAVALNYGKLGSMEEDHRFDALTKITLGINECTISPIFQGKESHILGYYDGQEYDRIKSGRQSVMDIITDFKKILNDYDVYDNNTSIDE